MGVYDFLKGPLTCGCEVGETSGDYQIKWFSTLDECFRTFRPGDSLPSPMKDGTYPLGKWEWCKCGRKLFLYSQIENNKFMGFLEGPIPYGWKSRGERILDIAMDAVQSGKRGNDLDEPANDFEWPK